ncbi:MAG: hypothetical protein HKO98_10780 [Gemmatimonadetes bacterium]|nr:hypothetical protein [Gemmatimonadota bacterium]
MTGASVVRGGLRVALAGALGLGVLGGCGDSTGPGSVNGLRPGTYAVKFELGTTIATPEPLRGRHDFTFRVSDPAASAADFELVSSRRTPPEPEALVDDYLRVDPGEVVIDEDRWLVRLPYVEGDYAVSVTLRGTDSGGISAPAGCYGRAGASASYLGAGCVIERR